MKTFLRRKDFSVSASISPAEVLTLSAPRTTFAPLFSFREQQAPSRIIEIKHLHEEDKLIKAKHNTTKYNDPKVLAIWRVFLQYSVIL